MITMESPAFAAEDLRAVLGEGWAIENEDQVAAIIGRYPVLQAALASRGDLIRTAFGHPVRLVLKPLLDEDGVEVDLVCDLSTHEWAEARDRVQDAWIVHLPRECLGLLVM
jgi:hypothetical protein